MDPFAYTTIASACMASYRANFIPEDTIAMVPQHGYVTSVRYSVSSIQWLDYISFKEDKNILHARNGIGEKKICGHYVDGFCEASQVVYQFKGKVKSHSDKMKVYFF